MRAQSRFRVARLSLFPSMLGSGQARYALTSQVIRGNVPHSQILVDGVLNGVASTPTTEEILEAMDAALRQHMLR